MTDAQDKKAIEDSPTLALMLKHWVDKAFPRDDSGDVEFPFYVEQFCRENDGKIEAMRERAELAEAKAYAKCVRCEFVLATNGVCLACENAELKEKLARAEDEALLHIKKYRQIKLANTEITRNDHVQFGKLMEQNATLRTRIEKLRDCLEHYDHCHYCSVCGNACMGDRAAGESLSADDALAKGE